MALSDYPNADSVMAGANITAPGANADIASAGIPMAGIYEILFAVFAGAGAVAADNGNARLIFNGVTKIAAVATNGATQRIARATLDGVNPVKLQAVGAATAAVVYSGDITLTRIA